MLHSIIATVFMIHFFPHLIPPILVLFFIPSFIAFFRDHHNTLAIFMVNLFFGWTFFGWFFALIWACTAVQKDRE